MSETTEAPAPSVEQLADKVKYFEAHMAELKDPGTPLPVVSPGESIPPKPEEDPLPAGAIKYSYLNSEFRKIVNVVTYPSAAASRKPEFRQAPAVTFILQDFYKTNSPANFYKGRINLDPTYSSNRIINLTCVRSITEATVYTVAELLELRGQIDQNFHIAILNKEILAKEPKVRKFMIESYLNPTIIELAKVAPLNPTLRSIIAAIFRRPPPPEADTYDKLKDWCEFEFDHPVWVNAQQKVQWGIVELSSAQRTRLNQMTRPIAFRLEGKMTWQEEGRCTYNATKRAAYQLEMESRWIDDYVTNGCNLEEIITEVSERFRDSAEQLDGIPETVSITTINEEMEDSRNVRSELDRPTINALLIDYLRRKYGTQEAQRIIDRP